MIFLYLSIILGAYGLQENAQNLSMTFSSDDTYLKFDISSNIVHSISIGPNFIHIKYFENMTFIRDEIIPVRSKNETIKELIIKLGKYETSKKKILVVSSYPETLIKDGDVALVLKRSYDKVFEEFCLLNAPQLYLKKNLIGFYVKRNTFYIQFLKWDKSDCVFGKQKVTNGGFFHDEICEYLTKEEYTILRKKCVPDKILRYLPIFEYIFDYFDNFKEEDWEIDDYFFLNSNSIEAQIPGDCEYIEITDSEFTIHEDMAFEKITTNALNKDLYFDFRKFIHSFEHFSPPTIHSIAMIFYMIKNEPSAFNWLINDICTDVKSFHSWTFLSICYLSDFMSRNDIVKFLQYQLKKINNEEIEFEALSVDEIIRRLDFRNKKKLFNIFMAVVVDRIKFLMDEELGNILSANPIFELIYKLAKSVEVISIEKDSKESKSYLAKVYVTNDKEIGSTLLVSFQRIFKDFDVFKIVKKEVLLGFLYAFNREYLQNANFTFYSYFHYLNPNIRDEEYLQKLYDEFKSLNH